MERPQTGIVIYRASRLEALLAPLSQLLAECPPDRLLAPQTVLAAHPGIKRWLTTALARERGPAGIVANLDVQLPSSWLQSLARERLGGTTERQAAYRRESLRWRIFQALPGLDAPELRRYLDGADSARRRFQLADRLAGLYARYMVYRPDWLEAWQQGRAPAHIPHSFLAGLWRQLRREIDAPHRGELFAALVRDLHRRSRAEVAEPLHVFGLSHLPPSELAVLRAVARERLVVLYLPDPCVEHWAGLSNEATQLRRLLKQGASAENTATLLELGHPLLAAWGRMGQHFGLVLNDGEEAVLGEVRHFQDYEQLADAPTRLHRLQYSLRRFDPALMRGLESKDDASLRIHGCHTRLRELEVLRDVLLKALADIPDLHPSQMVVMAPDIAAYAPLLPAVFGAPADASAVLPYHLADISLASSHPVFAAFRTLLDAPTSRLGASELRDLLAVPAIARALDLDESGLDLLGHWLGHARIAWGLDAHSRARFGLPAFAEHSFAWGMDRLLAGYVLGEVDEAMAEALGCWPVAGVEGVQVAALGALDRLLGEIDALCRDASVERPLSHWVRRVLALLDGLFAADPGDAAEVEALAALRRLITALEAEALTAGCDPSLEYAVVRELLRDGLQAVPERQAFLAGGITVCGMVPQRSIPFRVVAVLGLNDGEFPRAGGDAGIDLMVAAPRLGDRDVRSDDRYLFLETVMAARDRLHLSYLAEGIRDGKPRNPAAPLAELLAFLEAQVDLDALPRTADRRPDLPWMVRHALQPIDARYFSGEDPRWFSFRSVFAGSADAGKDPVSRFLPAAAEVEVTATPDLSLRSVLAYFRDPARQVLQERLKLRLDALDDDTPGDQEPIEARPDPVERLPQEVLFASLQRAEFELPAQPPTALRLAGRLPPGRAGQRAWAGLREAVEPLLQQARTEPLLGHGLPPREALVVERRIAEFTLRGALSRVHAIDDGWLLFDAFPNPRIRSENELGFRERLPLLIEWGLLRLHASEHGGRAALRVLHAGKAQDWQARLRDNDWSPARWEAHLAALLRHYWRGQQQPARYFPRTSWALAKAMPGQAAQDGAKAWSAGAPAVGERDYAPGYARLLTRGLDLFDEAAPEWMQLHDTALELDRLQRLDECTGDHA